MPKRGRRGDTPAPFVTQAVTGTMTGTMPGTSGTFTGTFEGFITMEDTVPPEPEPPEPEPPPTGENDMPKYAYWQQYADVGPTNRVVPGNQSSQWGAALSIASGVYPPGYKISNGQPGGTYPPQGATQNGSLPIRITPPPSYKEAGSGVRFQFYTSFNCTVVNDNDQDGKIVISLGVVYPSETDRPLGGVYLGLFHAINDFRQMQAIVVPKHSNTTITCIRMDVLDPDFAPVKDWPDWTMVPNSDNKLWPAIGPTYCNFGPVSLKVADIMCVGHSIAY